MEEKIIEIDNIHPLEIFGVNNTKIDIIQNAFPQIKIITRGNFIKLMGSEELINNCNDKINKILSHINNFGKISEKNIVSILNSEKKKLVEDNLDSAIILTGRNGLIIKARTLNQQKMVKALDRFDLLFAIGPAGTGKTYTAVAIAVKALKGKQVKRIILTRPAVEAGENLGFLPGDLKDKLDPYLQPLYDALRDMIPMDKLNEYMADGTIQIAPLAYMRGRTLDHAYVILDEAQNSTISQMKMFLTRMGKNSKFIVTGDVTQIDLPKSQQSGLINAMDMLMDIKDIQFVLLDENDFVRHKLIAKILKAYDDVNKRGEIVK